MHYTSTFPELAISQQIQMTQDSRHFYQPTTNFSSEFVPSVQQDILLSQPLPFLQLSRSSGAVPTGYSNTALDLTTMVFLRNIPISMTDYSLEQILWACGPVRSFKRVKDFNGRSRRCGFCTFEHALGMVRCLRVLGGEGALDSPVLRGM